MSTEDKKKETYSDKIGSGNKYFFYHKTCGLLNMVASFLKTHLKGLTHEANATKINNFFRSPPASTHTVPLITFPAL